MTAPMSRIEAIIAMNVRQYRIAQMLTQGELARAADISDSVLSDVEHGTINGRVGLRTLDRIADALGVPLYVLMMTKGEARSPKRVTTGAA